MKSVLALALLACSLAGCAEAPYGNCLTEVTWTVAFDQFSFADSPAAQSGYEVNLDGSLAELRAAGSFAVGDIIDPNLSGSDLEVGSIMGSFGSPQDHRLELAIRGGAQGAELVRYSENRIGVLLSQYAGDYPIVFDWTVERTDPDAAILFPDVSVWTTAHNWEHSPTKYSHCTESE